MTGEAPAEASAVLLTQAELQHRLVWVLTVSWKTRHKVQRAQPDLAPPPAPPPHTKGGQ